MNTLPCCYILIIFSNSNLITRSQELLQTIQVPDWSLSRANNAINKNCRFDENGDCKGICSINLTPCTILFNFDQPVCGCQFCAFNNITRQCFGQCENTVIQTCVSIKVNPKQNSDCVCAGCVAHWDIILTTHAYYYDELEIGDKIASCDDTTCYGNTCTAFIASKQTTPVNDSLYCACNNNFIGVTQLRF
jgi:hypothetical protein